MASERVEWRLVCQFHGERGHSSHAWHKPTRDKAEQSIRDLDHRAEQWAADGKQQWYAKEAPYRLQSRAVTDWADHDG